LKKRLIATLLALAVGLTAPVTVFASAVTVDGDTTTIEISAELIGNTVDAIRNNHLVFYDNVAYIPLRAFTEALGASVTWEGGTQIVTMIFSGATLSHSIYEDFDLDLRQVISRGNFIIQLQYVGGSLEILTGEMAGTRIVAANINDRFVLPGLDIPGRLIEANLPLFLGGANTGMLQVAAAAITGADDVDVNVSREGVTVTVTR